MIIFDLRDNVNVNANCSGDFLVSNLVFSFRDSRGQQIFVAR